MPLCRQCRGKVSELSGEVLVNEEEVHGLVLAQKKVLQVTQKSRATTKNVKQNYVIFDHNGAG
jgi:hypothetical protein